MPFCLTCDMRKTCKAICPELEKALPKPQGGISGRKIKFFAPNKLEGLATERAFELKYGKKYAQVEKQKKHNRQAGD
jgi:hypothetical protein